MAISKKTIFAINAFVLIIGVAIGAYFLYKRFNSELFCSYSDFDINKNSNLIIQPPYPEDAFISNSGDYKGYLQKGTSTESVVNVNQHPQDSNSNPVKFIEF